MDMTSAIDSFVRLLIGLLMLVSGRADSRMTTENAIMATPTPTPSSSMIGSPEIVLFQTEANSVNRSDLVSGSARVPVSWRAVNRPEALNLVFEQVMPNGSIVNIELPRAQLWVNSEGQGMVAPKDPGSTAPTIQIQIRLYSTLTQETFSTQSLYLPILDSGVQRRINSFTVSPLTLTEGDPLNVSWDVSGVSAVQVYMTNYTGEPHSARPSDLAPVGRATMNAPLGVRSFMVTLREASASTTLQRSVTVNVNCRYEWFSGGDPQYCPEQVQNIQATYQEFEGGYMLLRAGEYIWIYFNAENTFYVMPHDMPGSEFFSDPAPEGLLRPQDELEILWAGNPFIRERLGWALAPQQIYTMTYQQTPWSVGTKAERIRVYTLPDGRSLTRRITDF